MMFALLSLIISFISFPLATFYSTSADFLFSLAQKFNEYAVEFNFFIYPREQSICYFFSNIINFNLCNFVKEETAGIF
jgi:hypothetical protein